MGKIDIEFMYLDLDECTRCKGTQNSLEEAIAEVSRVLEAAGREIIVHKVHVQSEEQARELGFVSSPTIRVNGKDIQSDIKESFCESCGDICGDEVDCRVWVYRGKEYTVPPKAMIIDAILSKVYGGKKDNMPVQDKTGEIPDNLKRFFEGKRKKRHRTNIGCCSSSDRCCC